LTLFLLVTLSQLNFITLGTADASSCEISYSPKSTLAKTGAAYRLTLADGISPTRPGEPDLQFREFWVGIPQTGTVTLEIDAGASERFPAIEVLPVPRRTFENPDVFIKDPAIYTSDEFYPRALASIVEIGKLRDLRVAKIRINPAQYNPIQKLLRVYSQIQVRVHFSKPPLVTQAFPTPSDRIFAQTIINYPVCKNWRIAAAAPLPNPFAISRDWLKIRTEDEGVFKITYAALERSGYDPSKIDPKTFRLFNIGSYTPSQYYPESTLTEIPVSVSGENDGRFDKGDYILFYGRRTSYWDFDKSQFVQNPFTNYNYFWLTWGGFASPRMAHTNSATGLTNPLSLNKIQTTLHLETDSVNTAWGGLLWNWLALDGQFVPRADIKVRFPNGDSLVKLTGVFYPRATDNHLNFYLNQEKITTITFSRPVVDPYAPVPETVLIPVNRRLTKEENTFTFEIVGRDTATTFFDYFDADYIARLSLKEHSPKVYLSPASSGYDVTVGDVGSTPLIFDISNPFQPDLIVGSSVVRDSLHFSTTGGLYWITDPNKILEPLAIERSTPGGLRGRAAADFTIVAPDEFYDAALLLEHYRQGKVGTVTTVKLSEIYDDYGFGMEEPGAIKEFFKDKKPRYGLFAADGSYDYKNNLHRTVPPMIPPFEIGNGLEPSVYREEVAGYDSWFADFDGTGTTPDMALSRVTVRSPKELRLFIDKVTDYESNSFGPWVRRFINVADDVKGSSTNEIDHTQSSERISGLVGKIFDPVKVYLTEYPYEGSAKPEAKADILKELNRGAVGFCFFGHGNGHQLAHEHAFDITDVPQVQNGRRLPFCFFGSCGVGRFEDTNYECIAEEMVRSQFGAIGAFAATKGSWGGANFQAAQSLFTSLLDRQTFGDAHIAAMLVGGNNTYELFGDPTTKLLLPELNGTVTLQPGSFPLGGPIEIQATVPSIGEAEYSLYGYGLSFLRNYTWVDDNGLHNLPYYLPGQEFYRGLGKTGSDSIAARCFVPLALPRTTVTVTDGQYIPQNNTGRIDLLLWTKDRAYILRRDSIGIDTTYTPAPDATGPQITLYANGEKFAEKSANRDTVYTNYLPRSFTLTGELSDTSGILLLPDSSETHLGLKREPFGFYINSGWIHLADKFTYDPGSWTKGRFTYPVTLPAEENTIVVSAYDNLSNRTVVSVGVKTTPLERLAIEKPLVYPNPTPADAYFTFFLTKNAFVNLKIYSITGRLIRILPEFPGRAGYNQLHWEGRDEDGAPLANGVYFYKLSVHTEGITSGLRSDENATVIEKFIVLK
jgi:hypothetical protein